MLAEKRQRAAMIGVAAAVLTALAATSASAQSAGCAAMNGAQSTVNLTPLVGSPTDNTLWRSTFIPTEAGSNSSVQYFNDGDIIRWSYTTTGDVGVNLQARRFSPVNVFYVDPPGGTGGNHPASAFSTGSDSGVFTWGVDNTPLGTPNRMRIDLTGSDDGGTAAYRFSCTPAGQGAPSVTGLTPTTGSGGTSVTIAGSNFTGAYAVRFGAADAVFTVDSPTSITATAPSGSGTVDVTVTTGAGTSDTALTSDDFTYPGATPVVSALSTGVGSVAGGATVVLTGNNLGSVTAVRFGSTDATGFTVDSPTAITATAPSGTSGTVNVTVVSPSGTSATGAGNAFSYYAPPTVTPGFAPSSIPGAGVSTLTLTLANPNAAGLSALTGVGVAAATLPSGLVGSAPATDCAGGTATYSAGTGLALSGATLASGTSCAVTLSVTGLTAGSYGYTSGPIAASGPLALAGPSGSSATPLTITNTTQTISFTSTPPTDATVGGADYTPTATASSGLTVGFAIDASSAGVCALSGGVVSFTGVGTCRINADQAGNGTYQAAPQVQQSVSVGQGDQTISFTSTPPTGATVGGATYTPTATASSGLPVSFAIDGASTGVCALSGGVVSFTGTGTCRINADQAGDANYAAAPQAQQSVPVGQLAQTITFTSSAPGAAVVGGPNYTPTATATSGLTVGFAIDASSTGVCALSGGVVSFIGTGICRINADQTGNGSYQAAPQAQQTFVVGPAVVPPPPQPIPTLSEWAMILLSLILAATATATLQTRRRGR